MWHSLAGAATEGMVSAACACSACTSGLHRCACKLGAWGSHSMHECMTPLTETPATSPAPQVAPLVAKYAGKPELEEQVTIATLVQQNNAGSLKFAIGSARLLEQVRAGLSSAMCICPAARLHALLQAYCTCAAGRAPLTSGQAQQLHVAATLSLVWHEFSTQGYLSWWPCLPFLQVVLGKSVKEAVEWALQPGSLEPEVAAVVAAAKEQTGMDFVGGWRCCALPCAAVRCHVLLCAAMCCCALPCAAVRCHVLLCNVVSCCAML
jgi:hypothetical protein